MNHEEGLVKYQRSQGMVWRLHQATIAGLINTRTFPASRVKTYLASSTIVTDSTTKKMVHFCKPPNPMCTWALTASESRTLLALCLRFRDINSGKWEDQNKQGAITIANWESSPVSRAAT